MTSGRKRGSNPYKCRFFRVCWSSLVAAETELTRIADKERGALSSTMNVSSFLSAANRMLNWWPANWKFSEIRSPATKEKLIELTQVVYRLQMLFRICHTVSSHQQRSAKASCSLAENKTFQKRCSAEMANLSSNVTSLGIEVVMRTGSHWFDYLQPWAPLKHIVIVYLISWHHPLNYEEHNIVLKVSTLFIITIK